MTQLLPFGTILQKKLYPPDAIAHHERSKMVRQFLRIRGARNRRTGEIHNTRLRNMSLFIYREYDKTEVDDFISQLKSQKVNVYDFLVGLYVFVLEKRHKTIKMSIPGAAHIIFTANVFLRSCGITIDARLLRERIPLAKSNYTIHTKVAIDRRDIIAILNACEDMRRRTALLFMASTGARITEAASIRWQDLMLDGAWPMVVLRSHYCKGGRGRTIPLTREAASALRTWQRVKYKPFDACRSGRHVLMRPKMKSEDLVFAAWHEDGYQPIVVNLANRIREVFHDTLRILGKDEIDESGKQYRYTPHTLRRFAKTAISDACGHDFSEYIMGHKGWQANYYKPTDRDVIRL